MQLKTYLLASLFALEAHSSAPVSHTSYTYGYPALPSRLYGYVRPSKLTTSTGKPTSTPFPSNKPFGLLLVRSGSAIHLSSIQASQSSLFVNLADQNASCSTPTNYATFSLNNIVLSLYNPDPKSPGAQTVFVDRSSMGQGKIGYVTAKNGTLTLGRYWEIKRWNMDNQHLEFANGSVQACPTGLGGSWMLWLGGVEKPAGIEGCFGVLARVVETTSPVPCQYSWIVADKMDL
jgi:hypothetical protein